MVEFFRDPFYGSGDTTYILAWASSRRREGLPQFGVKVSTRQNGPGASCRWVPCLSLPKCARRGTKGTVLGAPVVVDDVAHPVLSPCITLITRWGGLATAALAGSTVSSFIIRGHSVFDVTLRQPRCARDWNDIRGGGNFRAASWRRRRSRGVLAKRARQRMLDEVRPSRGVDPREVSFVRTMT